MGIDPVHFGVMMILNLVIGVITPPFGTVLFVLSSVAKVPVDRVARVYGDLLCPAPHRTGTHRPDSAAHALSFRTSSTGSAK